MLQQYNSNITCTPLGVTTNYKQSNRTYGKDLSHSQTSRNVQDSETQSSFSRFTRQYRWGKSGAGCCMSVCTDLSQTLHRTVCSWLASSKGVSNASMRGAASTEYSYTLWEPEELRRRTGRQDTPECEPTTLNQPCYNKDTQCPEGTHTSQHIPEKKLVNQKRSSISGPGQLFPGRTGKPKSCQQLWKSVCGGSVLCLDIWTLLASSFLSKARKLLSPRAMAAQTDETASSQHNPTLLYVDYETQQKCE